MKTIGEDPSQPVGEWPLVGRKAEMSTLASVLARAATGRGNGQMILLRGEAGTGKTRLLREALESCPASTEPILLSQTGGWGTAPLLVWQRVLLHFARLPRPANSSRLRRQAEDIEERLQQRLGGSMEARPLGSLLSEIAHVVAAAARGHPLALLIDDVHRADPASLQVLEFVADMLGGLSLAVVLAIRDDACLDPQARESLNRLTQRSQQLEIRPLGLAEIEELQRVSGLSRTPREAATLQRLSGGNPFLLRELLENPDLGDCPSPGARNFVEARLSTLPADAQSVLQAAAVLGEGFGTDLLEAILPELSRDQIARSLSSVVRSRLLQPTPHGRTNLCFGHEIVREAILTIIDPPRAEELHARAFESFRARHGDAAGAPLEIMAYHALRGPTPADPSSLVRLARRAAAQLARAHSFERAIAYLRRAQQFLRAAPPSSERDAEELELRTELDLASLLGRLDCREEARAVILSLIQRAKAKQFPGLVARATLGLMARGDVSLTPLDEDRGGLPPVAASLP